MRMRLAGGQRQLFLCPLTWKVTLAAFSSAEISSASKLWGGRAAGAGGAVALWSAGRRSGPS